MGDIARGGAVRLPETKPARPVVLITGGSTGIGLALAREFAARGSDLFIAARDPARLIAAAIHIEAEFAVAVDCLACDLAQPGAAWQLLRALEKTGAYVHVLVNCAGMAVAGAFTTNDPTRAQETLQLNVMAATELMRSCLPGMLSRRCGGVLNVASLAGAMPMPYFAVYAATKSYLASLTRAVAGETKGSGVTISLLLPGFVDTEFFSRNLQAQPRSTALLPALSAATVARTAVDGFLAGQTVITTGALGQLSRLVMTLLPSRVLARMAGIVLARLPREFSSRSGCSPTSQPNSAPSRQTASDVESTGLMTGGANVVAGS
jgi:short-subunit dehydrogenase